MLRLTLSLRQATHAVILRVMSGGFLSPKDSRRALAADDEDDDMMKIDGVRWGAREPHRRTGRLLPRCLTALWPWFVN